jgi:hypothetical protein|tara:strand:- start:439 stop:651 length:213 start_codon:yes stop_codon:yes gene_type:complete
MFHNHNPNGVGNHLGQHSGSIGNQHGAQMSQFQNLSNKLAAKKKHIAGQHNSNSLNSNKGPGSKVSNKYH